MGVTTTRTRNRLQRLPSILDLLEALMRVSQGHPAVQTWWLAPRARLPLWGRAPVGEDPVRRIDLAVESAAEDGPDCRRIEREVSDLLARTSVTVRRLRPNDRQGMMRLLTLHGQRPEECRTSPCVGRNTP